MVCPKYSCRQVAIAGLLAQKKFIPESAEKLPADNSIELKDVRFAYHDKEVLHGVNPVSYTHLPPILGRTKRSMTY